MSAARGGHEDGPSRWGARFPSACVTQEGANEHPVCRPGRGPHQDPTGPWPPTSGLQSVANSQLPFEPRACSIVSRCPSWLRCQPYSLGSRKPALARVLQQAAPHPGLQSPCTGHLTPAPAVTSSGKPDHLNQHELRPHRIVVRKPRHSGTPAVSLLRVSRP